MTPPCVSAAPSTSRDDAVAPRASYESVLSAPGARYLLFNSALQVLTGDDGLPRWFSAPDAAALTRQHDGGRRALPRLHVSTGAGGVFCAFHLRDTKGLGAFTNVRDLAAALPRVAAVALRARALFAFHAEHRYCGRCGAPTAAEAAGARRRCTGKCGALWQPRVDAVVVALLVNRKMSRALLARKRHYAPGEFRALSAAVEHAENVDDAVRRCASEALGLQVGQVRWLRSQFWPYPHCLMLGVMARAEHDDFVVNDEAFEDARWFTREELAALRVSKSMPLTDHEEMGDHVPVSLPDAPSIIGDLVRAFVDRHQVCDFDD